MKEAISKRTKFIEALESDTPIRAFRIPPRTDQPCKMMLVKQFTQIDADAVDTERTIVILGQVQSNEDGSINNLVGVFDKSETIADENIRASIALALLTSNIRKVRGEFCIYCVSDMDVKEDGEIISMSEPIPFPSDFADYLADCFNNGAAHLMGSSLVRQVFDADPGRLISAILKTGIVDPNDLLKDND